MRILRALLGSLLVLALPTDLTAQEHARLGFEVGGTHYTRMAHDNSSPQTSLAMDRPVAFTLRFTSHIAGVGIGLAVSRSVIDFRSSDGGEFAVIQDDQARLWQYAPEVRFAVYRTSNGGRIYFHGGPVLDRWDLEVTGRRNRVGGMVGTTVTGSLGNGWDLDLRGDVAFTGSPFESQDFVPGVTTVAMRRYRVAFGMARKL